MKCKLFVHYSLIIRSLFVLNRTNRKGNSGKPQRCVSWGVLRRTIRILGPSRSILVAKRVPRGRHFESQNDTKIDPKLRSKFKTEKFASWDRLGSILGRFGGCPGGIFIDFLLVFVIFREHQRFRYETGPKTVWGRNLVENDAKLGSQNDPKSIQNRDRKLIKILIDF